MLAFFVYDLLGFCAREFPEKSEKKHGILPLTVHCMYTCNK